MTMRAAAATFAFMGKRPATYADLEALPSNQVGELLGGVLYAFPRPALPHTRAASRLGVELGGPFDRGRSGPGGWILLDEPELHLREDVLVPDLGGWRRDRMPELPQDAFITLAPDWVCEILSTSTAAVDRTEKMPIFARERVLHVWLVDPIVQTLEVYRLDGDSYRLALTARDDAKVRAEPFDAIELELLALWAR
jgi:Uma2 family endonuclease